MRNQSKKTRITLKEAKSKKGKSNIKNLLLQQHLEKTKK